MGDPSRRRHLLPAAIQKSKLSYLFSEIVDDLYPGGRVKLWTFDFYQSFILFFMAYWAVLYMHYMSQYLFLLSLSTPIFGFRPDVHQVVFKYSSSSLSLIAEIGIVADGSNRCNDHFLSFMFTLYDLWKNFQSSQDHF